MPYDILNRVSKNPAVEAAAQAAFKVFRDEDRRVHMIGGLSLEFAISAKDMKPVPANNFMRGNTREITMVMQDGDEKRFPNHESKILAVMSDGIHSKVNIRKSFERFMNLALSTGYIISVKVHDGRYLQKLSNPGHPNNGFSPV